MPPPRPDRELDPSAGRALEKQSGSIVIDTSHAPRIRVTSVGTIGDEAFRAYLNEYTRVLEAGRKYGVVFDALKAGVPSAHQRRLQADWIRDHAPVIAKLC